MRSANRALVALASQRLGELAFAVKLAAGSGLAAPLGYPELTWHPRVALWSTRWLRKLGWYRTAPHRSELQAGGRCQAAGRRHRRGLMARSVEL